MKGIIFDLGSTLLRFTDNYETVARAGAEAMAAWYFKKKHVKLDQPALVEAFLRERAAGRALAYQTHTEVTAQASLRAALKKVDAPPTAAAFAEAAIKIYFEPEETAWQPYADADAVLQQLAGQGYRIGLYSNATDDPFIQRLVNRRKLRPWLSPVFSSAGWGWRKPKPEPFRLIAERWGLPPQEVAVVGDTLNADILGAQQAGMTGVLVTMDEAATNANNRHIQPDASAATLTEAAELIRAM